jgi:hypothetical protein
MNKSSRDKSTDYAGITHDLRERGKGLSDIISNLRKTVEVSGLDEEYVNKIKDIEKRFSAVQGEISALLGSLSPPTSSSAREECIHGPPVIIRCKQWEDFKTQASNATTVSFLYRPEERTFQVDALKGGCIYTYSNHLPSDTSLLTAWLAKELNVESRKVLEGVLALG